MATAHGSKNTAEQFNEDILRGLDIAAEYRALGVELVGAGGDGKEWVSCWAYGRPHGDSPSAEINVVTGRYKDFGGDGRNVSLWDFAAFTGRFADWKEARNFFANKAGIEAPKKKRNKRPDKDLVWLPWNEVLVGLWCVCKPPITTEAVQANGGRLARYLDRYTVIALPVYPDGRLGEPCGWVLWNATGRELPCFHKDSEPTWEKMKTTFGSDKGFIGRWGLERIATARRTWKVEGPGDLLALWSTMSPAERETDIVVTNSGGCGERPAGPGLKLFAGKPCGVVHDCDEPGQLGAVGSVEKERIGWVGAISKETDCRNVILPYPIAAKHGKDLRDWLNDGATYEQLCGLYDASAAAAAVEVRAKFGNARTVVDDRGEEEILPLTMSEILDDLNQRTGGFPYRVGNRLFVPNANGGVDWLGNVDACFGWINNHLGILSWKRQGQEGFVQRREFYEERCRTAKAFLCVELLPHVPQLPGHFYAREFRSGDGEALKGLLDRLSPASEIDRDLLLALFVSIAWGGDGGMRPVFVVTSDDGRGAGKSWVARVAGMVAGGMFDVANNEAIADMKARLLSPAGAGIRIATLDNVKTHKFSWAEFESIVTSKTISGKALYIGESQRPNTLLWIITLNGVELSTDVAQRCVVIKVSKPQRSGQWSEEITGYIEANRDKIICDLVGFFDRPAIQLSKFSRWAAWESAVLARLPNPNAAQLVIEERQADTDVEADEARTIEDHFCDRLRGLGYVDDDGVFIPSQIAAAWYAEATSDRRSPTSVSRIMRQFIGEQRITKLELCSRHDFGRGLIRKSVSGFTIYRDVLSRIENQRLEKVLREAKAQKVGWDQPEECDIT